MDTGCVDVKQVLLSLVSDGRPRGDGPSHDGSLGQYKQFGLYLLLTQDRCSRGVTQSSTTTKISQVGGFDRVSLEDL